MRIPRELRDILPHVAMYLRNDSYDSLVAFISGFDIASHGAATVGFREWLIPQSERDHSSLHWSQLFLWLKFPDDPDKEAFLKSPENNKTACELLKVALQKFWDLREESQGMRIIYHGYEKWLRKNYSITPGDPLWIDGK